MSVWPTWPSRRGSPRGPVARPTLDRVGGLVTVPARPGLVRRSRRRRAPRPFGWSNGSETVGRALGNATGSSESRPHSSSLRLACRMNRERLITILITIAIEDRRQSAHRTLNLMNRPPGDHFRRSIPSVDRSRPREGSGSWSSGGPHCRPAVGHRPVSSSVGPSGLEPGRVHRPLTVE